MACSTMESATANKRRYTNIMVEGRQQGGNDEQRTEGRGHESTGTGAVMDMRGRGDKLENVRQRNGTKGNNRK